MYQIEYAALNYYHSPISDECLCLGVLFHNLTTGKRDFKYISNFQRFHSFDDEADVDFVRLYLRGIKEEVETTLFNYADDFSVENYTRVFANEFRFSSVRSLAVAEDEDYVKNFTHSVEFVNDKIGIGIVPQAAGLPASSQRIQKAAFIKPIREDNVFDLYVILLRFN